MPWSFSSNASSAARGDQANRRGDGGVSINYGNTGAAMILPLVAVVIVVALFVRRR